MQALGGGRWSPDAGLGMPPGAPPVTEREHGPFETDAGVATSTL